MGRRRSAQDADLQQLYDQVPEVGCKGLCQDACGPIDMSPREHARLRAAGVDVPAATRRAILLHVTGEYSCPALTVAGQCGVYEQRPMICRLWGATKSLRCPHGCTPERWLSDVDAMDLIAKASTVGGDPATGRQREAGVARMRAQPELQRAVRDYIATNANLDKDAVVEELARDGERVT